MKQNINEISGSFIDIHFSSHEEMSEMSKLWDLEQIQIEKGLFNGSLQLIHTPHIQIAHTVRSHGVIVKGKLPTDMYVFNYTMGDTQITHHGTPLTSEEIIILDDTCEVDFSSKSASQDLTVSIEKDFFKHTCETLLGIDFPLKGKEKRVALNDANGCSFKDDFDHWRQYLILNKDHWVNDSEFTDKIERNIVKNLCSHLGHTLEHKLLSSEENAIALQHYIENNYSQDITIKELCEMLNIKERSARPSFMRLFGLNPKEYLSSFRLGKFRNSLIVHTRSNSCISNLCYDQGLFHPSRLSREYKNMFGYLPSEILEHENIDR